uniref:Uncharacterized protein n=1 Tax=Spumella sp. NIES-1846 TaxID=2490549 RepID=A0A455RI07_9STRA|nr:hypothetical protein [Spumella sp. NIES-1846]
MLNLFSYNIPDLNEHIKLNYYTLIYKDFKELLLNYSNPSYFIYQNNIKYSLVVLNYLYYNALKIQEPSITVDECLELDINYCLNIYILSEMILHAPSNLYFLNNKTFLKTNTKNLKQKQKENLNLLKLLMYKNLKNIFNKVNIILNIYTNFNKNNIKKYLKMTSFFYNNLILYIYKIKLNLLNTINLQKNIKKIKTSYCRIFNYIKIIRLPLITNEGNFILAGYERNYINQLIIFSNFYFAKREISYSDYAYIFYINLNNINLLEFTIYNNNYLTLAIYESNNLIQVFDLFLFISKIYQLSFKEIFEFFRYTHLFYFFPFQNYNTYILFTNPETEEIEKFEEIEEIKKNEKTNTNIKNFHHFDLNFYNKIIKNTILTDLYNYISFLKLSKNVKDELYTWFNHVNINSNFLTFFEILEIIHYLIELQSTSDDDNHFDTFHYNNLIFKKLKTITFEFLYQYDLQLVKYAENTKALEFFFSEQSFNINNKKSLFSLNLNKFSNKLSSKYIIEYTKKIKNLKKYKYIVFQKNIKICNKNNLYFYYNKKFYNILFYLNKFYFKKRNQFFSAKLKLTHSFFLLLNNSFIKKI